MKNLLQPRFLIISNSQSFCQTVRENIHRYGAILYCKDIYSSIKNIDKSYYSAIVIDHRIDALQYSDLLLKIFNKNLSDSTIVFFEKITQDDILKYCRYSIPNLFFLSSINLFLLPTIKKILNLISQPEKTVLRERGISLYTSSNYAVYKGCKILLSKTEILIWEYLLKKDSICSKDELIFYLSQHIGRYPSEAYLTVSISRLRNKVLTHTGVNIVKNRSGLGYYISV